MTQLGLDVEDLRDPSAREVLSLLLVQGPMNQYRIEKATKLKHASLAALVKSLERARYISLDSEEPFRTGLNAKFYGISKSGFQELIRTMDRKGYWEPTGEYESKVMDNVGGFIQVHGEFSQQLYEELSFLQKIGAKDLFPHFVRIYVRSNRGMVLTDDFGRPIVDERTRVADRQDEREKDQERAKELWAAFCLRVLFPEANLDFSGLHVHPANWYEVTQDPRKLRAAQEQVRLYLRARKEFALFILQRLSSGEAWLEQRLSETEATRSEFGRLFSVR